MTPHDNLIEFKTPEATESFTDALTALVRQGAQQIIAQAARCGVASVFEPVSPFAR